MRQKSGRTDLLQAIQEAAAVVSGNGTPLPAEATFQSQGFTSLLAVELRDRLAETENTMAEFVSAISMLCRQAAERNGQHRAAVQPDPPIEPVPAVAAAAPLEPVLEVPAPAIAVNPEPLRPVASSAAEPVLDLPIPGFAQDRKPPGVWRIPVASSFIVACTVVGLLLRAI